jgi:acylphosphatase
LLRCPSAECEAWQKTCAEKQSATDHRSGKAVAGLRCFRVHTEHTKLDAPGAPKSSFSVSTDLIEFNAIHRQRPAHLAVWPFGRRHEPRFQRLLEVSATIPKFVSDEKQTRRYFVSGTVQGVGFRFFVQREANRLGVGGYARNLYDGRVEVLVVGSPTQLDAMKSALERGPRFSSVSGVREEEAQSSSRYEKRFVIEPNA